MKMVEEKLQKVKGYKCNNILSKRGVKQELSKLKEQFVFVPMDKAAKNVSLVCKKFYLETMTNEIEDSTTFEMVSNNIDEFLQDLVATYGKKNTPNLPFLYATTKMHKTPIKFRYITTERDTYFSDQSVAVGKCLNLLMKTADTSFDYRIKRLDNCNFVINSRDIGFVNKSNNTNDKYIYIYMDF